MRGGMGNHQSSIFMLFILALAVVAMVGASSSSSSSSTTTTSTSSYSTFNLQLVEKMSHSLDQWFNQKQQEATSRTFLTKLQIYIQADFNTASPNQTVFEVAKSEITSKSSSYFGRILVIDNPFYTGPDPAGSQFLGRYQGNNAYSDFKEAAPNMNMNIVFSGGGGGGGDYDGSTISILGRQPLNQEVRVLSVIGGTGVFRMAQGIVLASTLSTDTATQTGTYMYIMYVVTPAEAAVGRLQTA